MRIGHGLVGDWRESAREGRGVRGEGREAGVVLPCEPLTVEREKQLEPAKPAAVRSGPQAEQKIRDLEK